MTTLDTLLASFEARSPLVSSEECARRLEGLDFGRNLNRIQGLHPDDVSERLADLYTSGRISADEYHRLALAIAREKLDAKHVQC